MRHVLIAALLALAPPALAQGAGGKIYVVTPAKDGKGIDAQLGALTAEEAAIALGYEGEAIPSGTNAVILVKGRPARFTRASLEQIDREFGGDGEVEIALFDEKGEGGDAPFETGLDDIVPESGAWVARLASVETSGACPPGVADMIGKVQFTRNGTPRFAAPFHPRQIDGDMAQLDWTRIGADRWRARPFESGPEVPMRVTWTLEVRSPTRITITGVTEIAMPSATGARAVCTSTSVATMEKAG